MRDCPYKSVSEVIVEGADLEKDVADDILKVLRK